MASTLFVPAGTMAAPAEEVAIASYQLPVLQICRGLFFISHGRLGSAQKMPLGFYLPFLPLTKHVWGQGRSVSFCFLRDPPFFLRETSFLV